MNKKDQRIVTKIFKYCDEIRRTHMFFDHDERLFKDEHKGFVYRNALTMPILQIGELSKNLSKEFCEQYNKVPWREIMGMRDIFAHHYGTVDYEIVWNTAVTDINELYDYLEVLVNNADEN